MKNLKTIRKINRISQSQLAEAIGISLISLGRYERGDRLPTSDVLLKLARVLDCTVDELLEGELERCDK